MKQTILLIFLTYMMTIIHAGEAPRPSFLARALIYMRGEPATQVHAVTANDYTADILGEQLRTILTRKQFSNIKEAHDDAEISESISNFAQIGAIKRPAVETFDNAFSNLASYGYGILYGIWLTRPAPNTRI